MSDRFDAEAILRAACSGQIPSKDDLLVRGENGWFFGQIGAPSDPTDPGGGTPGGGGGATTFADIAGVAFNRQITESSVKQHEAALDIGAIQVFGGIFGSGTPFPTLAYTFANLMRRALRTITAADTTYAVTNGDWHLNVDISLGSVDIQLPSAVTRGVPGFTDQLHVKKIGEGDGIVTLLPATGEFIDDAVSAIIRSRNRSFTLVSDAVNWWIQ